MMFCQNGSVISHHWVKENYQFCTGIPLSCHKMELLKCTVPGMEHTPLKEERRWGTWSGLSHPLHLLLSDSAASPGQHTWYIQPGQVPKASSLPFFKASWACPAFHGHNRLAAIFAPCFGLGDIMKYRSPY